MICVIDGRNVTNLTNPNMEALTPTLTLILTLTLTLVPKKGKQAREWHLSKVPVGSEPGLGCFRVGVGVKASMPLGPF